MRPEKAKEKPSTRSDLSWQPNRGTTRFPAFPAQEIKEEEKEIKEVIKEVKEVKEDAIGSSSIKEVIKEIKEVKQYKYVKDENGNLYLR